jgi:methionyl-tRNA synthetase
MTVHLTTCPNCHKNYGRGDKCQHCGWDGKKLDAYY